MDISTLNAYMIATIRLLGVDEDLNADFPLSLELAKLYTTVIRSQLDVLDAKLEKASIRRYEIKLEKYGYRAVTETGESIPLGAVSRSKAEELTKRELHNRYPAYTWVEVMEL